MRNLLFAVAVWGENYIDTFLQLALPSFLAPGNIPACAALASTRFAIITRPEDTAGFERHPSIAELRRVAALDILPLMTADQFEGNRYSVMARAHRHVIRQALEGRSILSILSPDCIIADGGLAFGLRRILDGNLAVNVAGPRALLEDAAPVLTATPFCRDSKIISISSPDLVSLLTRHPHPISQILYWNADPFSGFPSAVYWAAGSESLLARYFHLHPIFVDMKYADAKAGYSDSIDGSLLTLANISAERVFVVTHSNDMCVVELSSNAHDPMASRPKIVEDKIRFMEEWARIGADLSHIAQFKSYRFLFQGRENVDWGAIAASADREMAGVFASLQRIEDERRQASFSAANQNFQAGMKLPYFNRVLRRLSALVTPGPATRIARILWPLMLIVKDLREAARDFKAACGHLIHRWSTRDWPAPANLAAVLRYDYDVRVVPHRAQQPGMFARLMHKALRALGIVFVVNMAPGMGHNTIELDYFLRLSQSGRLPRKRYVLLRMPNMFHNDTLALYRRRFWHASNNVLLNNLLAPVIARHQDIRLNVGLSRLRWHLRDDGGWTPPPVGQTFFFQISKAENRAEWMRYFRLRRDTRNMTPLKDGLIIEPALLNFLGGTGDRLALVHVKYHVGNATARPTAPHTYLPAIRWLQDQGYKVVMIGREKMPPEFAALDVLDYANSALACYRFDLELVAYAAIVITAGSGIAMMPDCMDVPLVYLNSWHIGMPLTSERCIMVPTLVAERVSGRLLAVAEQRDLYWALEDKGDEVFPAQDHEPRDATEDEVLAAVREALALPPGAPLSPHQHSYRRLTMQEHEALVGARISLYFIDKHADILGAAPDYAAASSTA
ncbi:MAG: TIGR04372 family glycosyltransferase [Bdellovibrionales bacterium]